MTLTCADTPLFRPPLRINTRCAPIPKAHITHVIAALVDYMKKRYILGLKFHI